MQSHWDYVDRLTSLLAEWDAQLDQLRRKAEQAPARARLHYFGEIEHLQLRRQLAAERIRDLKDAGEDATDEERGAMEQIWDDLRGSLHNLDVKLQ